eukprot:Clim_evm26s237 gene=Clim_evmTU26s237
MAGDRLFALRCVCHRVCVVLQVDPETLPTVYDQKWFKKSQGALSVADVPVSVTVKHDDGRCIEYARWQCMDCRLPVLFSRPLNDDESVEDMPSFGILKGSLMIQPTIQDQVLHYVTVDRTRKRHARVEAYKRWKAARKSQMSASGIRGLEEMEKSIEDLAERYGLEAKSVEKLLVDLDLSDPRLQRHPYKGFRSNVLGINPGTLLK